MVIFLFFKGHNNTKYTGYETATWRKHIFTPPKVIMVLENFERRPPSGSDRFGEEEGMAKRRWNQDKITTKKSTHEPRKI